MFSVLFHGLLLNNWIFYSLVTANCKPSHHKISPKGIVFDAFLCLRIVTMTRAVIIWLYLVTTHIFATGFWSCPFYNKWRTTLITYNVLITFWNRCCVMTSLIWNCWRTIDIVDLLSCMNHYWTYFSHFLLSITQY